MQEWLILAQQAPQAATGDWSSGLGGVIGGIAGSGILSAVVWYLMTRYFPQIVKDFRSDLETQRAAAAAERERKDAAISSLIAENREDRQRHDQRTDAAMARFENNLAEVRTAYKGEQDAERKAWTAREQECERTIAALATDSRSALMDSTLAIRQCTAAMTAMNKDREA